jgi:hypothetical protein
MWLLGKMALKLLVTEELRDPTEYVPPSHHLRMETDPVSETLFFSVSVILNNGLGPKTQ